MHFPVRVIYFSCLMLQQGIFTSNMNSSEVELWNIFSFTKSKGDHKVLTFGYSSTQLVTHCEDNSNNKVKAIGIIHVCNKCYV